MHIACLLLVDAFVCILEPPGEKPVLISANEIEGTTHERDPTGIDRKDDPTPTRWAIALRCLASALCQAHQEATREDHWCSSQFCTMAWRLWRCILRAAIAAVRAGGLPSLVVSMFDADLLMMLRHTLGIGWISLAMRDVFRHARGPIDLPMVLIEFANCIADERFVSLVSRFSIGKAAAWTGIGGEDGPRSVPMWLRRRVDLAPSDLVFYDAIVSAFKVSPSDEDSDAMQECIDLCRHTFVDAICERIETENDSIASQALAMLCQRFDVSWDRGERKSTGSSAMLQKIIVCVVDRLLRSLRSESPAFFDNTIKAMTFGEGARYIITPFGDLSPCAALLAGWLDSQRTWVLRHPLSSDADVDRRYRYEDEEGEGNTNARNGAEGEHQAATHKEKENAEPVDSTTPLRLPTPRNPSLSKPFSLFLRVLERHAARSDAFAHRLIKGKGSLYGRWVAPHAFPHGADLTASHPRDNPIGCLAHSISLCVPRQAGFVQALSSHHNLRLALDAYVWTKN